jgi:hypothetical protein
LLPSPLAALTTNQPLEKIPPLRPPLDPILPGFWDNHGVQVLAAGLVVLLGLALLIWWLRRPSPVFTEPPEVTARRALEALRGHPEDPQAPARVARALCRCVQASLGLPLEEWTSDELLAALGRGAAVQPDVREALARFLRDCEARAFAPLPPAGPPELVERALELLSRLEQKSRGPASAGNPAAGSMGGPAARPPPPEPPAPSPPPAAAS